MERIAGKRTVVPRPKRLVPVREERRPDLLIDIQQKIQEGKGEGYEHWARLFNIKQMAHTLSYLADNGIRDYDALTEKARTVSAEYHHRLKRIKEIETRQKEITELQKYISQYGKTRNVYAAYKASKWDQGFFDVHAADIILHQAAKKYFNEIGKTKLPSINTLKQEWATLDAEKKNLYSGYRELKDQHMALMVAKKNADAILGIEKNAPVRDASRERKRSHSHEI
jgi:hypothetical protein